MRTRCARRTLRGASPLSLQTLAHARTPPPPVVCAHPCRCLDQQQTCPRLPALTSRASSLPAAQLFQQPQQAPVPPQAPVGDGRMCVDAHPLRTAHLAWGQPPLSADACTRAHPSPSSCALTPLPVPRPAADCPQLPALTSRASSLPTTQLFQQPQQPQQPQPHAGGAVPMAVDDRNNHELEFGGSLGSEVSGCRYVRKPAGGGKALVGVPPLLCMC